MWFHVTPKTYIDAGPVKYVFDLSDKCDHIPHRREKNGPSQH